MREDSTASLERLLSSSDSLSTTQGMLYAISQSYFTPTHWYPWQLVVDRVGTELSSAQQERLYSAAKRVGHLTELLHETEANCARLAEQAKLLKEEIRRLFSVG